MVKKNIYAWALFLLSSLILISHTLYVYKTHSYPEWDEHKYLGAAVKFLPILRHPDTNFFSKMLEVQKAYLPSAPPFYPLIMDVPLLLFGTGFTYKMGLWINVVFYIATIIGIYFLGKEFLSKKASLLASFIFAFYGFPLFYLHFTYAETAATAFSILSLCFLAKSRSFLLTKNVVYFSLFFALGFFTRWTVPIFILGPMLVCLLSFFSKKSNLKKSGSFVRNIFIFLLFCMIPVFFYYLPNFSNFMEYFSANSRLGSFWMPESLRNPISTHSFIWYGSVLAQQTIFFFFLFLSGLFLSIKYFKKYAFLFFAIALPYAFLTFGSTFKDDRFIVPMYPAMALVSAIVFDWLALLRFKKIFITLMVLTIVIGLLNFLGASWGIGPMRFSTSGDRITLPNSVLLPMPLGHQRRVWLTPISWPPRIEEGNAYLISQFLKDDWKNEKKPAKSIQTFEMSQIGTALYAIGEYENIDSKIRISGTGLAGIKSGDYQTFFKLFGDADYILVKNGIIDKGYKEGQDKNYDAFIPFVRIFNKAMKENQILPKAFVPVKKIFIPFDKSNLIIYRKKREIAKDEWEDFAKVFIIMDSQNLEIIENAAGKMSN